MVTGPDSAHHGPISAADVAGYAAPPPARSRRGHDEKRDQPAAGVLSERRLGTVGSFSAVGACAGTTGLRGAMGAMR